MELKFTFMLVLIIFINQTNGRPQNPAKGQSQQRDVLLPPFNDEPEPTPESSNISFPTSENPGQNPGSNPGQNLENNPGQNLENNPGQNPGSNPGPNPENNPGQNVGNGNETATESDKNGNATVKPIIIINISHESDSSSSESSGSSSEELILIEKNPCNQGNATTSSCGLKPTEANKTNYTTTEADRHPSSTTTEAAPTTQESDRHPSSTSRRPTIIIEFNKSSESSESSDSSNSSERKKPKKRCNRFNTNPFEEGPWAEDKKTRKCLRFRRRQILIQQQKQ